MKVPQENSPFVGVPTTRAGGGCRVLISARWALSSLARKSLTSLRNSAAVTVLVVAAADDCATALLVPTIFTSDAITRKSVTSIAPLLLGLANRYGFMLPLIKTVLRT